MAETVEDLPNFIDPRSSSEVWDEKSSRTVRLLKRFLPGPTESSNSCDSGLLDVVTLVASPVDRWRQRCLFLYDVKIPKPCYVLQTRNASGEFDPPYSCYDFPIASMAVSDAMARLTAALTIPSDGDDEPVPDRLSEETATKLRSGLCRVGLHGTQAGPAPVGDMVCTLFYDSPIDSPETNWLGVADELRTITEFSGIVGRSRGTRLVSGHDYVIETLKTNTGKEFKYKQIEGHFSNPNSHIAAATLDWLCAESKEITEAEQPYKIDLLEMFCGNGNHTMALSQDGGFRKVLGVEINSVLVAAAQENIAMNKVSDKCSILRAPSAKFVTKMLKRPDANRPKRDGVSADASTEALPVTHTVSGEDYCFRAVLVDPPRAGLDQSTRSHLRRYKHILYISCNPDALARDLDDLCGTHQVKRIALFDHFPRTHHLETAVHLEAGPSWEDTAAIKGR